LTPDGNQVTFDEDEGGRKEVSIMVNHHDFNHQVWRTTIITVALAACFVFGIIVLASRDWLPGGIIVAASSVGIARQVAEIRKLCSMGIDASSPHDKPAKPS
jgi:lipopolysaccharide/colanic/teichoic acid biosynthesis glycosyltransferase